MQASYTRSFSIALATILVPVTLLVGVDVFAAEQTRNLPAFTSISSDGVFNLKVSVGEAQSVKLSSEEENLDRVGTEVVNGELKLTFKNKSKNYNSKDGISVLISLPNLSKMRIKGVGPTEIKHIKSDEFELNYEGVGMVKASGKVKTFSLNANGVGKVDAHELKSQIANVSLNGVGEASVYASDTLNASLNGIGSMVYYGKPPHLNKTVNGLGKVSQGD